ncbi:Structural maintenance of chromosomes protein 4, partial [Pseudolycoriella hygida]
TFRGRDRIQTPENVHRLYDLIKYEDPQVLPAFYFALHDTLVADDIEQATRIAYGAKRYRTVTLKGELIEISGSMSGGGRPIRGRMGQQVKTKTSRNDANTSMSGDNLEK